MVPGDGFPPPAAREQFARAWGDALATFAAQPEGAARILAVALRAARVTDPQAPAVIAATWREALAAALTDPHAGAARLSAIVELLDRTTELLEALMAAGGPDAPA